MVQPDDVAAQSEHQFSQFHAAVADQLPATSSPPLAQLHHSTPCFHQYPPVNYSMPFPPEPEPTKNMKTTIDEVVQWRTLPTFLETLTFVSACWWFCFPELPRPAAPANEIEQSCNMWTEFQRSGIFDGVAQWRTLSTFLETLTFVSACWWFCFPELPRPPAPADEFEQSCNMWTEWCCFAVLRACVLFVAHVSNFSCARSWIGYRGATLPSPQHGN